MKRREFIQSTVALPTLAAAGGIRPAEAGSDKARVKGYRPLGKTGIKMSDISFGAGKLPSASMILRAIDRGINYFDTAPDYGHSERHIGEALQKVKQRDRVYIASKMCDAGSYVRGRSHLQLRSSKADYKAALAFAERVEAEGGYVAAQQKGWIRREVEGSADRWRRSDSTPSARPGKAVELLVSFLPDRW